MHDIEQLIEDHELLDNLARDLIDLVRSPPPCPENAYATLRRLSASVNEHLSVENGFLYGEHFRAKPGRLEQEVEAFERDFRHLDEEWPLYMREWTPENIAVDWLNFAHSTLWVMGRFRDRIAQENDILYPLALQSGRIRLRGDGGRSNLHP